MQIEIPHYASKAIELLEHSGYEAYCVGGCVRDTILGKSPYDWDICTNALPEQMKEVFFGYFIIETGIKHGTLTIIIDRNPVEITTYRSDGAYEEHRKPAQVKFISDLEGDLLRRDFTMNSLCFSGSEIVDKFGGVDDINNKIIRCVGDPELRFEEDALRILRALRFASILSFEIEEQTKKAIHEKRELLSFVSSERILTELYKLIGGAKAPDILMQFRDVFAVFIPEIESCFCFEQNNPHHAFNVWEHICRSVGYCRPEPILRLAMLFHDIAKPLVCTTDSLGMNHFKKHPQESAKLAVTILKRLRSDNGSIKYIHDLIWEHDNRISIEPKAVKRFISKYSFEFFMDYLEVRRADTYAQSDVGKVEKLKELDALAIIGIELDAENACMKIADLAIDGNDMISLGFEGKQIGETLLQALEAVISDTVSNNKQQLIAYIKEKLM